MTDSSGSKSSEDPMLLICNVRSLKKENELPETKFRRQPSREAKNAANRLMVKSEMSELDVDSDFNTGESLVGERNNPKTNNEPIRIGAQKYGCPFCSKTMPIPQHMKQHILIHTGEQPFSCKVCGKMFNNKSNLTKHTMLHTGEKPFSCDVCGKSFTLKENLKRHLKRVHPKIE